MDERPEQRPEGTLIAAALKRSRLSQRQAATRAGISENRWRAIMHGYQNISAGVFAPIRGPGDTVARMARVVGVAPEQLEEAGRADAAEELRNLPPEKPAGPDRPTVPPEVVELLDQRLAEVTERIAAREVRIVEALRKALGDEATEKLLAEEATDEPNGEDRRHAG